MLVLTDAEYLDAKWAAPVRGRRGTAAVRGRRRGHDDARRRARSSTPSDAVRLPYAEHDLRFVAMLGEAPGDAGRAGQGAVELPRFSAPSRSSSSAEPLIELGLGPAFDAGARPRELIVGPGDKALGAHPAARPRRRRRGGHRAPPRSPRSPLRGRLACATGPLPPRSSTGPSPGPSSTRRPAHCCSWAACCNPTERSD